MLDVLRSAIEHDPVPVLAILCGILGGVLIVCTAAITRAWKSVRIHEADAALKQEMLDRGMSAEEIERVVRASARRSR
jgi:hypothetical protein